MVSAVYVARTQARSLGHLQEGADHHHSEQGQRSEPGSEECDRAIGDQNGKEREHAVEIAGREGRLTPDWSKPTRISVATPRGMLTTIHAITANSPCSPRRRSGQRGDGSDHPRPFPEELIVACQRWRPDALADEEGLKERTRQLLGTGQVERCGSNDRLDQFCRSSGAAQGVVLGQIEEEIRNKKHGSSASGRGHPNHQRSEGWTSPHHVDGHGDEKGGSQCHQRRF